MAGKHRARNRSIQIIRTATVAAKDCKRTNTLQFHVIFNLLLIFYYFLTSKFIQNSKIKFPLPHRIQRPASKQLRSLFLAKRPNTHFQ